MLLSSLHHSKVELKQFRRMSCHVTECDRELAVAQSMVALEPCFHNRQYEAPPFHVVN